MFGHCIFKSWYHEENKSHTWGEHQMVSPVAVDLLLRWKPGCGLLLLHFYLVRGKAHVTHCIYDWIIIHFVIIIDYSMLLRSYSVMFLRVHVNLTNRLCWLFPGLIAGDSIAPANPEVGGKEGASVTLRCTYATSDEYVDLYWYRQRSNQAPQFILYKGAKGSDSQHIPDTRYESTTSSIHPPLALFQSINWGAWLERCLYQ